jgi:competence protein ComGC
MTTSYTPGPPKGMAVAALVLGICSLVIPVLGTVLAIVALVLGIIVLTRVSSGQAGGKGMAIGGVVTGGLGLLCAPALAISILLPALSQAREAANRVKCAANLHAVSLQLFTYCSSSESDGHLPDSVDRLVADGRVSAEDLVCPSTNDTAAPGATPAQQAASLAAGGHDSYLYLGKGLTANQLTPDTVLIYEPPTNHHDAYMNVVFGDGRVDAVNKKDLASFMQAVGRRAAQVYWPPHHLR